jgi:hypothetical protein
MHEGKGFVFDVLHGWIDDDDDDHSMEICATDVGMPPTCSFVLVDIPELQPT